MGERGIRSAKSTANLGRLTNWQVIDAFPDEIKEIVPSEIRKAQKILKRFLDNEKRICQEYPDDFERFFFLEVSKMMMPDNLKNVYENYLRNKDILKIVKVKEQRNNTKLDVELARIRPIEELYRFEKVNTRKNYMTALCPFHNEKTPSFYIYFKTNHFYCYGCGINGDSIGFQMKISGKNYVESVQYLMGIGNG